jgi:hypothetical protein
LNRQDNAEIQQLSKDLPVTFRRNAAVQGKKEIVFAHYPSVTHEYRMTSANVLRDIPETMAGQQAETTSGAIISP